MENKLFFDPYNYMANNIQMNNPIDTQGKEIKNTNISPFDPVISPKEFYENQYIYYRYLNEALDYQIKRDEYTRKKQNENSQK